jgi:hypothetical protein
MAIKNFIGTIMAGTILRAREKRGVAAQTGVIKPRL